MVDIKEHLKEQELSIKEQLKQYLSKPKTLADICYKFTIPPKTANKLIKSLQTDNYNITVNNDLVSIAYDIPQGGYHKIDTRKFKNRQYRFGFVTDNHLCSKYERLDILHAIYDIYEQEGITDVYNAGNMIDGEARFNKYDIHTVGLTAQVNYLVKEYPQRKGIKTKYITGDDHEGWYQQREGINIGRYIQNEAKNAGRDDLEYLGYIEADIPLKAEKGQATMKIMHPGGGSSYALSYTPQKIVESFTGGEKPSILLIGHYHKSDFLPDYRNVAVIQGGTTQDQTPFMRKKKLAAHLGGWIIEVHQSEDGAINRVKPEWLMFFDKSYYKKWKYCEL